MSKRSWLILTSALSLLALFALASGLRNLDFQPGHSFGGQAESLNLHLSVNQLVTQIESVPLWKRVLAWAFLVFNVWLIARVLPPEMRKRLLLAFIRITLFAWGLFYLVSHDYIQIPDLHIGDPGQAFRNVPAGGADNGVPVFQPPQLASWTSFLVSLAVVAVLLALGWGVARAWPRRRTRDQRAASLDEIGRIARSSLDGLSAGGDWQDLILQSYARMAEAVGARPRLKREDAMTPREFALRLERAGLPRQAVHRLTALFEAVRYGTYRSSPADANEAAACLSSILQYCQESA
jgi:hypothetical protein